MNYKEKYEQALENFKKIKSANSDNKELVNFIEYEYPELKESEDERIMKDIIDFLKADKPFADNETLANWIAWLEKQREKKSWSEEDESWFKELKLMALSFSNDDSYRKHFFEWLKSLKNRVQPQPKQEWSKEDESNSNGILDCYKSMDIKWRNWLKSIKPNHWKPSEQNLKDLEWCADLVKDKMGVGFHRLQVFIDEIKKL